MTESETSASRRVNLGAGDDVRDGWYNVDRVARTGIDETIDLNETPWPLPDESVDSILASHVLEHLEDVDAALQECARLLTPGGRLVIKWPIGMNQRSDDTHRTEWVWRTPENKLRDHWQADLGLRLESRDVDLHPRAPAGLRSLQRRKFAFLMDRYGPGEWCWRPPGPSLGPFGGEFIVEMVKP
jgi:SAM-dependent methyltransferase